MRPYALYSQKPKALEYPSQNRMAVIAELRKHRIFGMAIFDWVATMIGALLLSRAIGTCFAGTFVILVIVAIITHAAFGIPTMLNVYLDLAKKEDLDASRAAAEAQASS